MAVLAPRLPRRLLLLVAWTVAALVMAEMALCFGLVSPLRLALFLGLVFHKLLWEAQKRRHGAPRALRPASTRAAVRLVKLLKGAVLTFLVVQTLFLDLLPIAGHPAPLRILGGVLYLAGLGTAVTGRLQLGKNWVDLEDYRMLPDQSLVTRGIYAYIRHPIYTGDVFLLAGLELALNSWLVLAVAGPLVVVTRQALAEEALLAETFPGYRTYCARTKRFIPFVV